MRLKVSQLPKNQHTDIVTAVGWNSTNELFTCSDDQTIWKWNWAGEPQGKVFGVENTYFTDVHWFPSARLRQQSAAADVFVVSCTDGTFKLVSKTGRLEKSVDAHKGAVIAIRWNYEGTALVTAGEDGFVKIWSRAGIFRSTLAQTDRAVYSVAWGPDSDQVLFSSGNQLIIKPIQPSSKQVQWKAHDAPILKVDWNVVNNLIISGGEDCKYKVWDSFGRLLYSSPAYDYCITSVAWAPDGEFFGVGAFNLIRLCDKTGWTYSKERAQCGSIFNISWTSDGTQLAGAGGNGAVIFGQVIERGAQWKNLEIMLGADNKLRVQDAVAETVEELDFRDRVVKLALGYGHLIAATATQCHIYAINNWNTPHIFDVKDTVNLIVPAEKIFVTVDNVNGVQVYDWEARVRCNPKFPGLRTEFLSPQRVSLSNDCLAIIDGADAKVVRLLDPMTGKMLGDIKHGLEAVEISLSQYGAWTDRKVALIDRNRDLYISPTSKPQLVKLGTMVDSMVWNDRTESLAALMDGKLFVWYYPNVMYVDRDLLGSIRTSRDASEFGKNPQCVNFFGNRITIRRMDGAIVTTNVSAYPSLLYEVVDRADWDHAIRLCRFVKDPVVWSCLAAMAMNAKELNTAEVAYAAIDEVDKVQYVLHIKEIPTVEGRNAEVSLFMRKPEEAEAILLQAGLIFRAIKLNITLYNWDRALELAVNHKTHVDTVLAYRQKWLKAINREESNKRFSQYASQVAVDWDAISAKIAQEKEKERSRPGAKPYQ
mmetsp:Transcript_43977/g.71548  ORF Transcript_43977/g.71548 Transcript_43977/m.71548 type:complete len:763 (+) Transcript_43977:114-2402(+)|eukprot:CAMPEP_0184645284 /NCGR_PEP_ID=MMETSP0308-20130426/1775_1 /TAXON_ID=38269 /ORGANISM="Gloeochaete witrockiana, Strain SAG 46.84" /LENGTH=762 /DNA_ID=CAMNT_0027074177 /DNA_START=32 /DNA_END=2320 /DNA_ORIENTATION=-